MSETDQDRLRPLRNEEDSLVRALLLHVTDSGQLVRQLEQAQVRDMDDGGMGSLKFAGDEPRSLGNCLMKAEYRDRDGILVSIALNADTGGRLYELDIWRMDFAPLQEYPDSERLAIKT
ncbi:DUF6984 family protein [Massilia sp. BKSP1R2A-1]|uniref:DUF6984 family protein n=1 Tax=Massilia sp. BKSP1R2A-1 TaxID=3422595 RepID=UPI003D356BC0